MRLFALFVVLLLLPMPGKTQISGEMLDLKDCVRIALENNVDLRTSQNLARIAELNVTGSYSNILPSIDASASGARLKFGESTYLADVPLGPPDSAGNVQYEQRTVTTGARSRNSYSASLSINQNIFDGGYWWNNIRMNKVRDKASKQDLEFSENQVIKQVSQYYYDMLKNVNLLEVYSQAVQRSQDQLDRSQSMYEIGSVAQVDVYRSQVNLGQDRIRYLNQKNTVNRSQQFLNLAMGRDPLMEIRVDTTVTFEPRKVTLEELLELSFEYQPALRSQELNVKAQEFAVALAKSAYWPSVGARFRYSRDNEQLEKVYSDFDQNWSYSIGLGLSWNLFNGFADRVNVQKSQITLKNTKLELEDYKRALRSDIRHLYNTYEAIIEIVEINEKNLQAAREEYRLASERYRLGSGTSLELREAQVNLTEAEQVLVAAKYNAIITYIELYEAAGKVKEAIIL
ncbi:MAG: TolC family protein [Calditrichaeota bacterium]|nr:TolC family protein [Calditrichota bacterium]RQV92786.1 MAG: TolC family protein [bacterium]RQW00529.1 MAG: TolC family protein [Calditrichota bacterium]